MKKYDKLQDNLSNFGISFIFKSRVHVSYQNRNFPDAQNFQHFK